MNRSKFILVLLSAVLGYGQLVANFHVAGHVARHDSRHMHAHDVGGDHSEINGHSSTAAHWFSDAVLAASHLDSATNADGDKNAENDCAIYHVYLNLGSNFGATLHACSAPLQRAAESTYAPTHIASTALAHHRIRAPPIYS